MKETRTGTLVSHANFLPPLGRASNQAINARAPRRGGSTTSPPQKHPWPPVCRRAHKDRLPYCLRWCPQKRRRISLQYSTL